MFHRLISTTEIELSVLFYRSSLKRIHILSISFSVSNAMFYFAVVAFISLSTSLIEQGTTTFESAFM